MRTISVSSIFCNTFSSLFETLLWFEDYSITLPSALVGGVWKARLFIMLCLDGSELFCHCSQKNVLSCVKHKWDIKLLCVITELTSSTFLFSDTTRYLFYNTLNVPVQKGGKDMYCFLERLKNSDLYILIQKLLWCTLECLSAYTSVCSLGEWNFKIFHFQLFFAMSAHGWSSYSQLSLIILCFETFSLASLHNIHYRLL